MREMSRYYDNLLYKNYSNLIQEIFLFQLTDLPSTSAPIFFSIIQAALPEGVKMNIKLHEEEDELVRYVPDQELTQLKSELEALGGASKAKQPSRRK